MCIVCMNIIASFAAIVEKNMWKMLTVSILVNNIFKQYADFCSTGQY